MFLIMVSIVFVYLSVRFFDLADEIAWGFDKIAASIFFVFAAMSLFVFVIVESVVFFMLPVAFMLVAIDLLKARCCPETIR